jgi:HK97 family phage portal protein
VAVVASSGSLVATHRENLRPSISRSLELYSGRVHDYASLYRLQPNLRLVIRFLSRNIASLGLKPYRRISRTEREELEPGHPLRAFLKNPTPILPKPTSLHAWIRSIVEDLALYDLLFVLKLRNEASGVLNGIRVPPTMMEPIGDAWLWAEGFRLKGNRGERDYAAGDVIYLHGHNPEDPRTGLSPVEALRRILAEEAASGEWREQYWRNGARIAGVIERPLEAPKWSDTAKNRFSSDWRAARTGSGPDAGGTPILEDGMVWKDASFSSKESEYLGARRLSREEVAAAYFIPPVFVGILENANFSNVKEQHVSLYADTLGPWLDWISQELELQLLPEFPDVDDVYLEFQIEEKLRGRFEEQAQAIQSSTGAPWMTRNEARALRNLPRVEGGDDLVVPLNVLVGGQASPTDSAPDPGTLSRSSKAERGAGAKAALPSYLRGWEAKHVEVLESFFSRQSSSVISRLGAGQDLEEAFDRSRWDGELRTDLLALSLAMAEDVAAPVASDFGSEFDLARAEAWLAENARIAAEGINSATFDELALAWSGVPRRGEAGRKAGLREALEDLDLDLEDDELDDVLGGESFLDPAREVFALAIASRIPTIAVTRATSIGQWSRREAASQAGARSKTWVASGASNSRHAALDGETVPLGEAFSNGGQYPGDPALGVDETAGCLCSLDFSTT